MVLFESNDYFYQYDKQKIDKMCMFLLIFIIDKAQNGYYLHLEQVGSSISESITSFIKLIRY